jgi:seryl-tRNA synthetase
LRVEEIDLMSAEVNRLKEKCTYFRTLLDEGAYKLDSVIKIIDNVRAQEVEIRNVGADEAVLQHMDQEQIDQFLEMLKSPAFQNIARQLLVKLVSPAK